MNDMILNMLANNSFTVSDFKAVGLTAENTKLESEDKYKQSQMIQNATLFKDDEGNFSDEKFHQYYLYATQFYNNLADDTYIDDLTKNTFYSKDNLFAPEGSHVIDETPRFVVSPNPFLQTNSLTRVGKKGDRTLSISEIAQTQKIYDSEKGEFRDESVNDRALGQNAFKWLSDLFSEPLVIAQWDEDGTHIDPITGKTREHKKGDYKYNDEGTFYYETLNGRDVYGRQVLNKMNTLTVDGSKANKYDFFDSDDLEQKSFIGNTMKNLALVGTMFIPYVGIPIKAASIAMQSVGLLGALGKMFLGSENKTANTMHAWAKTVSRQTATEYASQNTWCWENLINMVGDTVGQLAEQRFLFTHVPALLKGTKGIKARDTKTYQELLEKSAKDIQTKTTKDFNKAISSIKATSREGWEAEIRELGDQWVKKSQLQAQAALEKYMQSYNNLGSIMSKAYMTGITVQDTYGEAKANGASDAEAFWLTLGYAAGELAILNTGVGEWIMPELHGDKLKYRSIINALKKEVKPLSQAADTATKEGRQNFVKKIFNIGKKVATDDYARQEFVSSTYNPMKVVLAHAMGESVEELSEEVLADFSKTAFNMIGWLRGDETRMSGAWKDMGDRYGMSLLGGFIGGGISSAGTDFSYAKQLGKMTNESAIQEIIYMVNNDKIDGFLKFVNKADLGNKYLSTELDENGNYKAGTKENNQDSEIKKMLNLQVQLIKDVINAEGAKFSENALFDAVTLKDLRYLQLRDTVTAGALFQEYNSLVSQIIEKHEEIRKITGENTNTDTKKKELTEAEAGKVAQLKQELNDLRVRKDAIVSGKRSAEFIQTALYEAQEALHGHLRGYTFEGWVKTQTGKNIDDLTESEIKDLKPKYKAYRETEMKNDILGDARQFVDMVGMASKAIQDQQEYIKAILEEGKQDAYRVQTYLGNVFDAFNSMTNVEEFDVDEFIQKVQNDLNKSIINIAEGFAAPMFDDETLSRLHYINTTPDQPGYGKREKNLDKIYTIFEAFANYSDTITHKFIEQGYIHPEVKNHLIQTYQQIINVLRNGAATENNLINEGQYDILKHLSVYFGDESNAELAEDIDRGSMLNEYADNLEQKIEQIEELHSTPIIELLENFKIATSNSNFSIKDVMQNINTLINEGFADVSSIGYGEEFGKQLDEVDEVVDVLASALYATRVDESGVRNAWGYSKTLNELNKKYGNDQWVELAEIKGATADLLQQDLALIKQKIKFAKNLNAVNNGQKLNRQNKVGYNKQFIFYNKLHKLFNILPSKLVGWKGIERVKELLKDDLLLSRYNGIKQKDRRFSLTPEEKIQIERESLMIDDALYEFFNENADKLENVDELAKLINPEIFQMYDPANTLLSDESDDLDDIQFIFNLAAKAAVKSSTFYNTLRKTFNDAKAPVPIQEQATYLNVAMVMNGNVMNNFAKAYSKSIFEHFKNSSESERKSVLEKAGIKDASVLDFYSTNPDAFQNDSMVDKFANIILTEGIAGSGKTGGVFDSTVKIIEQINPELLKNVFIVNSTLENANKLKSDLGLEGKTFSSSHKETDHDLIRYFYSDYTSDYKDKVILDGDKVKLNFTLKEDLVDLPKVIFIDEASRYDYVQMRLLSEAAQHYGIAILAAGDFDQISVETVLDLDSPTGKKQLIMSPNRLNFIFSPKLGLSFRTLNSQMSKNQKEIIANLHEDDKRKFNIFYWENEEEIRGFKVHENTDLSGIEASIEKIKKSLNPDEKIGLLYAHKDISIYKKLEEKYGDLLDIKSIDDAQGLEGNYYIIDLNQDDNKTPSQIRKELYTAITRARHGGIIINNKSNTVAINNVKEEISELESITPEAIKKATSKRKEIFDSIFDGVDEESMIYTPLTPVKRELPKVVTKPDDGSEKLPPPITPIAPPSVPPGMYRTREEAEKVDLSSYKDGLEVYDTSSTLIGTITGTSIETKDVGGIIYYAPAVIIDQAGTPTAYYVEEMLKYTLKDPSGGTSTPVAKYKVGDVFYDSDGNMITISEVILIDPIKYKITDSTSSIKEILETDLASYSTIPPDENNNESGSDLGENVDSETYRQQLENTNGVELKPNIDSDGKIQHWMYTFNAYETGVVWDGDKLHPDYQSDTRIKRRSERRIDNVNGLMNHGAISDNPSKQECLEKLSDIHDILMNETDNGKLLTRINAILNPSKVPTLDAVSIQYGIKSSARSNTDAYGTAESETSWHVFDKHSEEKSEYSHPNVIDGDAISRKTIVAVFRDANNKKIFEVTLGVVNSPLTIGSMVNSDGNYIYDEVGQLLATLNPNSSTTDVFNVCTKAIEICDRKGYIDLKNLFKSFLFTSNGFAPLHKRGETFNLAKQRSFGPNVIKKKGDYQKNGAFQYDTEYVNLEEFIKDDRVVVSDIYIPQNNTWAGHTFPVHQGYPGVFVSYNKSHRKEDLPNLYLSQTMDPKQKRDVEFYYIIPPESTVSEYLKNYRNSYLNNQDHGTRAVYPIGNMWTSYNILKNILKGGDLTEDKFKSKLLNHIELKDLIDYLNKLIKIEEANYDSDPEYQAEYLIYKNSGFSDNLAKKYALRKIVLSRQTKLLKDNFTGTTIPAYVVFTRYIANAAYWDNNPLAKPDKNILDIIEKHNKGNIKYKIKYDGTKKPVGLFIPAKVSGTNPYATDGITEDGNLVQKHFQINRKIDPPIFEIPALTTAIGILAQWEYEDPNNTNSRKMMGKDLNAGTHGYKNDNPPKKSKTNFELLKDNNKILFGNKGLFKDIPVKGSDDPAKTQIEFAEEILIEFNSHPNNLGFAIVDPSSGKIKLYAYQIDKLKGDIARPENETLTSLGGITIGQPLIFSSTSSEFTFNTSIRSYQVNIDGNNITFTHTPTIKPTTITKVEYTFTNNLTEESFDKAISFINSNLGRIERNTFNKYSHDDILKLELTDKLDLAIFLESVKDEPDIKEFYEFLNKNLEGSINLEIGDTIFDSANPTIKYNVVEIIGDTVKVKDSFGKEIVFDVKTVDLYKQEKDPIHCPTTITINYGK